MQKKICDVGDDLNYIFSYIQYNYKKNIIKGKRNDFKISL